jgi:hypothetical protein
MARATSVTVGEAASSATIPINWRADNFGVSIVCVVDGDLTYKVQHTVDDIYALAASGGTPTWLDHSSLTSKTANADGNYAFPITAVRLTVTAYADGDVTMTVLQSN